MAAGAEALSHKTINTRMTPFRVLTGPLRALPDFVIIGAQKCGTSSLYRYLADHPTVAPAVGKEIHYFDWNFRRGVNWYRGHFPTRVEQRLFRARTGQRLFTGEASPYYMVHPLAPVRLKALIPDAKLIALLRDPVERTLSAYHHQFRNGEETSTLEEALDLEPQRLAGEIDRLAHDGSYNSRAHRKFSYMARGRYAEQLESWLRVFPREQLLVIRSEDFFERPAEIFAQVLDYIGLPAWQPSRFPRFNAAEYPDMDPAMRDRLVRYFGPENDRLSRLLGRDFQWSR